MLYNITHPVPLPYLQILPEKRFSVFNYIHYICKNLIYNHEYTTSAVS